MAGRMAHPVEYPDQPVLARVIRGAHVESQHRGAWALVDSAGHVHEGAGEFNHLFFARSAIKCLQALPLIETGAADRFRLDDADIALALASHNAEPIHTARIQELLLRLGLSVDSLLCGPQLPGDRETRRELLLSGADPSPLHNNCSGKHAGFLALTRHLSGNPERYLDLGSPAQSAARAAIAEMVDTPEEGLTWAIDGCSAPTYRLSLKQMGTAFARITSPDGLSEARRDAAERMLGAVERYPELIAGNRGRLCTAIARASRGSLFPKIGAEAIYAVGALGRDRALVVKIDDGANRALHAVVLHLLQRFDWLEGAATNELSTWMDDSLYNWAGLEVGRIEVTA